MKKHLITILFIWSATSHLVNGQSWTADNGNGTYSNPLFFNEFSDPDIIHIGNDFYLADTGSKPEMIEYCTATNPAGPWAYKGIIEDNVPNSFTTHPGIIDYKGSTYFFYHNGSLHTGGSYRRSVCIDYLYYNPDSTILEVVQTTNGVEMIR